MLRFGASNSSRRILFGILSLITAGCIAYASSLYAQSTIHDDESIPALHSQQISSAVASVAPVAPRSDVEQQRIDIYKRLNDAVVFVTTREIGYDLLSGPVSQEGTGSGVIVDAANGYVVSNFHVVGGALAQNRQTGKWVLRDESRITATLGDGKPYLLEPIGADPDNDVALLKIIDPPQRLIEVPFGESDLLEVGQRVLAIGNPFGLNRTLTDGIISSLGRSIQTDSGRKIDDVIQTDAAINPGNSGGPLLDMSGRLIGINTAIVSRTGEYAGIGFAIPANMIRRLIPQLVKYGRVLRPKLGIALADTTVGAPIVQAVISQGPAEASGLRPMCQMVMLQWGGRRMVCDEREGDLIIMVNGRKVRTKAEVLDEVEKAPPGSELELTVVRGGQGKPRVVKVKPVLG